MRNKLWRVLPAIYMAALSLFTLFDAVSVIRISDGYIPLFGLTLLLMVAALFAALTAIALAQMWHGVRFLFWAFSLAWSFATYVDASVFRVMCITETGWYISLAVVIVVPTMLGLFLIRKASTIVSPQ